MKRISINIYLKKHEAPAWFNKAKLGIFVHWGLSSVPAYAPTKGSIREIRDAGRRDWFKNNAYAEWYLNTLWIKGSPTHEYHLQHYGELIEKYRPSILWNDIYYPKKGDLLINVGPKPDGGIMKTTSQK